MATVSTRSPGRPASDEPIPPLIDGDRLSRPEFERRYDAMPHLKKAELIDGIVHMPPPSITHEGHSSPHFDLISWLGIYRISTPGVIGGDNGSIRLDLANMPQPDAFLLIAPDRGGQTRVSEDDYLEGAPELVAEVSFSTVSHDLIAKKDVYRRHKAREYLIWRTRDRAIDWFILRGDDYERLEPGPDGILRSEVFPGLWLDVEAMTRTDLTRVAQVQNLGLASPEHAAFVDRLKNHAPKPEG
jgi:Uma2 family endonuclease